ncbi:MAG: hypothetical protein HS126_15220 [Anaerolineales bacterium]|nr:hypothetical protein [Anaerolineales bacterium]
MITYEQRLRNNPELVLKEASLYFNQKGDLYRTLQDLSRRLDDAGIPYALIGGLALAQHGFVRMTEDIHILLTAEGLQAFKEQALGHGYVLAFSGAKKTFRSTDTGVRIEIITSGEYPGDGLPKPVSFPDPASTSVELAGLRVVSLEKLIELKLASGITAAHRRRDLADVQDLIRALQLGEDFGEKLDASVRQVYAQLWREAQAADRLVE